MSVISFKLLEAEGEGDNNAMRSYHTLWQAITNDPDDHALTVLSSPLMPNRPNSIYSIGNEIDLLAYASKAKAKRPEKNKRTLWHVSIDFTTKPARESNDNSEFDNPLDAPVKFTGEFVEQKIRLLKDLDNNPIENSAGDAIPLEADAPLFRMQFTKNFSEWDVPLWKQYAHKAANSDQFWDAAQGTVLMGSIRPQIEFWQGGIPYYPTTIDVLFLDPTDNKPDWQEHLVDRGPRYWTGGARGQGAKVAFRDGQGLQHVDGVGNLNGQGGALAEGAALSELEFRVKQLLPFGVLLPTTNPYA